MDRHQSNVENTSNYTIEEIEEMDCKIEEERRNIHHILEIKQLLVNGENKTETEITVSLQKLALIVGSLEDLMVTNIGTTVSGLQLHWSKKVIRLANTVAEKFKMIIEERFDENADILARTEGQDPPTIRDEHPLFNLPMDEGIPMFYLPELDFTKFFEDIDDDGNSIIHKCESKEFHECQINPSESSTELTGSSAFISTIHKQKQDLIEKLIGPTKKYGFETINKVTKRKQESILKDSLSIPSKKRQKHEREESIEKRKNNKMSYRPSDTQFSLKRFANHRKQKISNNEQNTVKKDEQKVGPSHSRLTSDDAAKIEEKLETTKRKLHQGYQAHERERRSTKYLEGYELKIPKDERRRSRPRYSNRSRR